jgi:hypothetical protein
LLDNKVQLYMRSNSPHWQCSCSVGGKQRRTTTKEESLARAKDVARDWYLTLLGKYQAGGLRDGKTFREAAERFMDEYETLNRDQRSAISGFSFAMLRLKKTRQRRRPFSSSRFAASVALATARAGLMQ